MAKREIKASDCDFLEVAFSTMSRIFETVDSPNSLVVRSFKRPLPLTQPLTASSPGRTSRGRASPVRAEVSNEEMPSDNAVLEAASLAAFFSKAIILEEHMTSEDSKPGLLKAEVDYCPVSHVKKIPGAKPGMVIYEGYYSVLVEAKEPSSKDL